jgi:hypothetical protein
MKLLACCCSLSFVLAGCSLNSETTRVKMVTDRAAFDLSCENNNVKVVKISDTSYGAAGCGSKVTYLLDGCDGQSGQTSCKVSLDAVQSTNTNLHHVVGDAGTD